MFTRSVILICLCVSIGLEVCSSSDPEEETTTFSFDLTPSVDDKPIDNSLADWEAPKKTRQNFPIYISGFDYEGRPVAVAEYGKWDVRKVVEEGGKDFESFDKYIDQSILRFTQGSLFPPLNRTKDSKETPEGGALIIDLEGFNLMQVASIPTLKYIANLSRRLAKITDKLAYAYFLNVNFVAERAINLAKPALGTATERIEVYGTNQGVWKPKVLRNIPADQIPPWLGGKSESNKSGKEHKFKPVFIY